MRRDYDSAACVNCFKFANFRISAFKKHTNVLVVSPGCFTNLRHSGPAFALRWKADVKFLC